jgi:signal peptidase I
MALSVLAALVMVAVAIGVVWLHVGIKPVLSGSMRPTFVPGSVIVTRTIPTTKVRPGDVILFTPPGETSPFAHRVMSVSGPANHPIITTKGDANPVADPWKAQIVTPQVSEVIGSVAGVGRLVVAIHGTGPRLLLIALSGLIFCVVGTRSILGPRPSLEASNYQTMKGSIQ